jgi:drug/metabolite transporter (DMT)-like permease
MAALGLALAAAFVHAAWNLILAREEDSQAATAVALPAGMLLLAPFSLAFWDVQAEALPYAAASAVLELAYLFLLARAYDRAALSVVYPVARGSAPVIVLLVTVAFLGEPVTLIATAGVVLVAAGILLVRGEGKADAAGVLAGLAIGLTIAGYTLTDASGVDHASAVPYLLLSLGPPAIAYPLIIRPPRSALTATNALAGAGMVGSYLLVLAALEIADADAVPVIAAARETSVVIAVAFAALFLKERVSRNRVIGSAVVVAGVALLSAAPS